jgi:hypothetical protein
MPHLALHYRSLPQENLGIDYSVRLVLQQMTRKCSVSETFSSVVTCRAICALSVLVKTATLLYSGCLCVATLNVYV